MRPLIFLDTETTGINNPRLVEIAWRSRRSVIIEHLRVCPPIPIEESATEVHGIRYEDVQDLPSFQKTRIYPNLKKLFESSIIVAHNAPFDAEVLANEGIYPCMWIDTKMAAKALLPHAPSFRLQDLRQYCELQVGWAKPHSADGDVAVLAELFDFLIDVGLKIK